MAIKPLHKITITIQGEVEDYHWTDNTLDCLSVVINHLEYKTFLAFMPISKDSSGFPPLKKWINMKLEIVANPFDEGLTATIISWWL